VKKKSPRKLELYRETLRRLDLVRAGAFPVPIIILPPNFTRGYCDSVASCSALAEDCCVVGAAGAEQNQNVG